MKDALKRWIKQASSVGAAESSQKLLMGGIDLVTPSMVNGWVWHPNHDLYDVRLLAAGKVLASSRVDIYRKDVVDKVGSDGNFAFSLKLSVDSLQQGLLDDLQLVALTADGSTRFTLLCMKDKGSTQSLIKTALDPQYLGMEGNFDGLSNDGVTLSGWCFQPLNPHEPCTVFFQVEGIDPVPVRCGKRRPGFADLGYPENCGFEIRLDRLAAYGPVGGKRLVVTFDQSGLLPLPEATQCSLPLYGVFGELAPLADISRADLVHEHVGDLLQVHEPVLFSDAPDLKKYQAGLEEFKRICDVFEQEIASRIQEETLAKRRRQRGISGLKRLLRRSP